MSKVGWRPTSNWHRVWHQQYSVSQSTFMNFCKWDCRKHDKFKGFRASAVRESVGLTSRTIWLCFFKSWAYASYLASWQFSLLCWNFHYLPHGIVINIKWNKICKTSVTGPHIQQMFVSRATVWGKNTSYQSMLNSEVWSVILLTYIKIEIGQI